MRFCVLVLFFSELLGGATCCPAGCDCSNEEVVVCGPDVADVPSPVSPKTILLRLAGTRIAELGERSFLRMPALLAVDLSRSRLRSVHEAAFAPVPRLQSLKLASARLSSLPARVFANLTGLGQLFLSGNELEEIPPGLFDALAQLNLLDLSGNRLASLDADVFRNLRSLVQLDLGKNALRRIPATVFSSLAKLTYLRLYFNRLESLEPGTFDDVGELVELDLFNNNISDLSPRMFWKVPKLVKLTLSRNRLQTIPARSFYHLPNLVSLTIYKNPLTFLPNQLMGLMPRLKMFYLYETQLDALPENLFCNMTTLEMLSVTFNSRLRRLPKGIFSCLSGLYRLKLEANSLQFLHRDLFSGLINLETLILSSNKLQSLPGDIFRGVPKLANLSLDDNRLETLPGEALSMAAGLRMVTLRDNPWRCTCVILDFARWVGGMRGVVHDYEHVLCHTPSHLRNTTLGTLSPESMGCWVRPTVTTGEYNQIAEIQPTERVPLFWNGTTGGATTAARPTPQTADLRIPSPSGAATTVSERTSTERRPPGAGRGEGSRAFYDVVILQPEYSIVHNNRRRSGWVYLWTLPPSGPYLTFLVVFHVLLVATCVALIVGGIWALYRLNRAVERVAEATARHGNRNASKRERRFSD